MSERFDLQNAIRFTNSEIDLLPTTLGQINPAYYNQIAAFIASTNGSLRSYYGYRLYDTLRVDVGTMPISSYTFFAQGQQSQGALFVAGTSYTKQDIDTNLQDDGKLPTEYDMLIWGFGCEIITTGVLPTSSITSGNTVNLTNNPGTENDVAGAASVIFQSNLLKAYQESCYVEFFVNNATFENGTLDFFPAGPYGTSAGRAVDGNNFIHEGRENNGFGLMYNTPIMRYLPSQMRFGVRLNNRVSFTNTRPTLLRFYLEGLLVAPITG